MAGIEVYLRESGDRMLLNIYVPTAHLQALLDGLREGTFSDPDVPANFEASINGQHVRLPIGAMNLTAID